MPFHTDGLRRRRPLPELTSPGSLLETTPEGLTFRGTRRGISVSRGTFDEPGAEIGFQPAGGSLGPPQDELAPVTPEAVPASVAPTAGNLKEYAVAEDARLRAANAEQKKKRDFFVSEGARLKQDWPTIENKLKEQGVADYKPYTTPKNLLELMTKPTEEERLKGITAEATARATGTAAVAKPLTAAEVRVDKAKAQAKAELDASGVATAPELTVSPEVAAAGGTGPFRMIAAAVDAVLGAPAGLVGIESLAPDTQQNRQVLRVIRQMGKAALLNSSRGAIWEQKKTEHLFPNPDVFFTNPGTEAGKLQVLRDTLAVEKVNNNKAIVDAVSQKEIDKLRQNNNEIDNLLGLIGTGQDATPPVEGARKAPDNNWYVPNPDVEGGWMRVD